MQTLEQWMTRAIRAEGALVALRQQLASTPSTCNVDRRTVVSAVKAGLEYYDIRDDLPVGEVDKQ